MEYVYYDDEGDYEDARSRSTKALKGQPKVIPRLDTAETSYAKNRLRDDPRLEKVAKARLLSAANKGRYGGDNREEFNSLISYLNLGFSIAICSNC